jgi:transposase
MSTAILGIDIAKQRFEVALLVEGKIKNKSFKNLKEGFETLALWLRKLGIQQVNACLEATGNYGEDLAIFLHEAGHTVSIVNPARVNEPGLSNLKQK